MYWGLVLKTNKRYSQQITKGFHVSNATLDLSTVANDAIVSIWVHTDDSDHLLCNLSKQLPQVALDLVFSEGETVAFYSKGNGTVHLNGNIMQDDEHGMGDMGDTGDDEELDEEAEDEEIEDYADLKKALIKEKSPKAEKKSNEVEKEDSEEDSEDSDDEVDSGSEEDSDDDDDEDMLDDDDDDDDDVDEEEAEEEAAPPAKKGKMEKEIKQNGVATNGKPAQKQNDQQKKQKGAPQEQSKKDKKQQQTQQKPVKKTLSSGVVIEDLITGKGPEASAGKRLTVYYIGRLQKTNKVFDSSPRGEGFKFQLGKGDVIRGWDIGVVGMRVGGKRRIVCPPGAAYGPKGQPPVIPSNATLVFEVTLNAIN